MVAPKHRSFATPLEWMRPRTAGGPWRPWVLPASLSRRARYVLLCLGIVTAIGLGPFVVRDPLVPPAQRIAAILGLAALMIAWTLAYRRGRHHVASLAIEGIALSAVCSGVGAPHLAVGLVSAAIFYSAMFPDLHVARAAGLVYSAAFLGAVTLTSHPKAMAVWSPATISPLVQFAVLGGLLFSMGRMIERTEREQERAAALRGLGEALGAATGDDDVAKAWIEAAMSLGAPLGAAWAVALQLEGGVWRVIATRGELRGRDEVTAPRIDERDGAREERSLRVSRVPFLIGGATIDEADMPEADPGVFELDEGPRGALLRALGVEAGPAHVYRFSALATGDGSGAALVLASATPLPEETCAQLSAATNHANVALGLSRTRAAMVRAERLAAIGQLAASMAHELRNPLAAIRGAATWLKRHAEKDPTPNAREVQFLEIIEREVASSNRIITELLDFARSRPPMRSSTVLRDVVEEVRQVVPLAGAKLVDAVPEGLPPHAVDRDQIRQVLANLVQNAVEAAAPDREAEVTVRAHGGGDAVLVIEIQDNGIGMDAEVAARAFEPLYTTKTKGTGLGLAIVGKIVAAHGGRVRVDTKPGEGTLFAIELPPAAAPAA